MQEFHPGHYQITRKLHSSHLTKVMPIIALIYGTQIILMSNFAGDLVKDSLIFTGLALVLMLTYFFSYDHFQKTVITPEKIVSEFLPFYEQRAININEIQSVQVVDPGAPFSTLNIKLTHGGHLNLYFVDSPDEVACIIENYRAARSERLQKVA